MNRSDHNDRKCGLFFADDISKGIFVKDFSLLKLHCLHKFVAVGSIGSCEGMELNMLKPLRKNNDEVYGHVYRFQCIYISHMAPH